MANTGVSALWWYLTKIYIYDNFGRFVRSSYDGPYHSLMNHIIFVVRIITQSYVGKSLYAKTLCQYTSTSPIMAGYFGRSHLVKVLNSYDLWKSQHAKVLTPYHAKSIEGSHHVTGTEWNLNIPKYLVGSHQGRTLIEASSSQIHRGFTPCLSIVAEA